MMANLTTRSTIALLLCLAASLFLLSSVVKAQGPENDATVASGDVGPSADDTQDPPSRVARISFTDGSVSLQPGGTGDWGTATKNRPMTIGDKLWVDQNSRAELQAGQAALHLGSMTAISFLNLDENITQVRLAEGKLNFRVREIVQGDNYEVDTPNLAFTVREAGAFRIDVNENGDYTSVTAIRGQGEIAAGGQTYPLHAGERADVTGTDNNVKFSTTAAPAPDDLDRWAQDRDLKEDNSPSAKYVSRDTVGYSDLDDYGTWSEQPDYGPVWTPNTVEPGWAPYSYGYWNWVGPWGWTWVGYEPWGFAPFHYGRWNWFGSYWGWCPGPMYGRPFYGPAFVGFLGGGFGFGFGFGHAWFPLGWGEPFHPWYHAGGAYWRNVNVHNTFIRNTNVISGRGNFNYRYAHNANAVTAASHSAFVNGQAINRGATHLSESALRGARVTNNINASPTRASYLGASNSHGRVATPSASVQNRSVMARTAPAVSASHLPVRTMNNSTLRPGNSPAAGTARSAGTPSGMSANRQSQLSSNRPPSAMQQGSRPSGSMNSSARPNTSSRTWSAQGNSTDSGRAPQGFGSTNRPSNSASAARSNANNRPPWAGSGAAPNSASRNSTNRPPSNMNGNRSYRPPSYNGNRGYSAPRSNSAPRSYAPPHGSSAPRSYSAPHSSGGGSSHGGGGSSHGGGGSSHSSGGSSHGGGGGSHGGSHR